MVPNDCTSPKSLSAPASRDRLLRGRRGAATLQFGESRSDSLRPIVHRVFRVAPLPLRLRTDRNAAGPPIDRFRRGIVLLQHSVAFAGVLSLAVMLCALARALAFAAIGTHAFDLDRVSARTATLLRSCYLEPWPRGR